MTRILLIFLSFLIMPNVEGQNLDLVGLINYQLVKVDSMTAKISAFVDLSDHAPDMKLFDLSYDGKEEVFYALTTRDDYYGLVKISKDGAVQIIGVLSYKGVNIPLVKALAYNPVNGSLYISANISNDINKVYAESIMIVDTHNAHCQLITNVSTEQEHPDIDVMALSDGDLYFFDGDYESDFGNIYKLQADDIDETSVPELIYKGSFQQITDFAIRHSAIYFTVGRQLYKHNTMQVKLEQIGTTHTDAQFNGQIILGLTQFPIPCQSPKVDLGNDTTICEDIVLDVTASSAKYLWQDGSTQSTFQVKESGKYWVSIDNGCEISADTIDIQFLEKPSVDLGSDTALCAGQTLDLDVTYQTAKYLWDDGTKASQRRINAPGMFTVSVFNSCGIASDSIIVTYRDLNQIFIPNIITPNQDRYNAGLVIDERILGSEIEIFNRWGKTVYHSPHYENNWYPEKLKPGNYFYTIKDQCFNEYKGWLKVMY